MNPERVGVPTEAESGPGAARGLAAGLATVLAVTSSAAAAPEAARRAERDTLIRHLRTLGVGTPAVLEAMRAVPRHEFMPEEVRPLAYRDHAVPIGHGQTISQPAVVARMTALLDVTAGSRVLEIGTGSGYQAAVLARLGATVYSVEIVPALARRAAADLRRLGFGGVRVREGDGFLGWSEAAPFDRIIVTCAVDRIPAPLLEQVRIGGRIVAPVGPQDEGQVLTVAVRQADGTVRETRSDPVRFVPMTGPRVRPAAQR